MITPRVLAVANAAGSAGKTTTVVSLAAILASRGKRVLVVDGDAQATATSWLRTPAASATLTDVLLRDVPAHEAAVATPWDGISVVPADRDLDATSVQLSMVRVGRERRLTRALESVTDLDFVLIDCPGQITMVTVNALVAADQVLSVTQPTMKELGGVQELQSTLTEVSEAYNPTVTLAGIVPCNVPPSTAGRLYSDAMQLATETWPNLLTPRVRHSVRVPESHAQATPLPYHAPQAQVTADYEAVYAWLVQRGTL